jgi:predicted nuclease of predicted toxin-antitoxin system
LKVLFDEGVPRQLVSRVPDHDISTVKSQGWLGVKNVRLLALVESSGFRAFVTNDKQMVNQQQLAGRPFAVLFLSCNHWETMEPHVAAIAAAIENAKPGDVSDIFCGRFVPSKFRGKPAP